MVTRKAILKQDQNILIPITRGEAVIDSKGAEAFHSYEFVASTTKPGLLTPQEKQIIANAVVISDEIPENSIVQVQKLDDKNNVINVFPTTKAEAVIVTVNNSTTTLDKVIAQVTDMDDYPIQNSTKGVTSGGVWQHIDDTVGVLHREVNKI